MIMKFIKGRYSKDVERVVVIIIVHINYSSWTFRTRRLTFYGTREDKIVSPLHIYNEYFVI